MTSSVLRVFWIIFCLSACLFFFGGFIYMIHLTHQCIVADLAVAEVLHDPKWAQGDWMMYLGCAMPLGFSLIWGSRFWLAVAKRMR